MSGKAARTRRAAAKTMRRTRTYLAAALLARPPARDQVLVSWGLVAAALWAGLAGLGSAPSPIPLPLLAVLLATLAAICAIDSRWGLIPDPLSGIVFAAGIAHRLLSGGLGALWPALGVTAAVLGAGWGLGRLHVAVRGYEGFGQGDVKLIAAAMPWVGLAGLPALMIVAVASAALGVALLRLEGPVGRHDAIAFGPHLALGLAWTALLWG